MCNYKSQITNRASQCHSIVYGRLTSVRAHTKVEKLIVSFIEYATRKEASKTPSKCYRLKYPYLHPAVLSPKGGQSVGSLQPQDPQALMKGQGTKTIPLSKKPSPTVKAFHANDPVRTPCK
jgi:hypothetical protein